MRKHTRLRREMIASADYLHSIGGLDDGTHAKITMRDLGGSGTSHTAPKLSAADIRALRDRAHMSQAVFAKYLNVSTGYISQLERGTREPTGAAVVLLDFIRRNGMDALLGE